MLHNIFIEYEGHLDMNESWTHGNLILQKPFLHFRARLNCDLEQNFLCHVVDHTKYINTQYLPFFKFAPARWDIYL